MGNTLDRFVLASLIGIMGLLTGAQAAQKAGTQAEIGKVYSVGATTPRLFVLKRVEFSVTRVSIANTDYYPKAQERLLVLHFTVQNPLKAEVGYNWGTLRFTAVDVTNLNRPYCSDVGAEYTKERLDISLKPAQKVDAYTVIVVPATGVIPKLIVQPKDGPVLRYDLRGKVKGLTAPIADPKDTSGITARSEVPAQLATYYPMALLDLRVDEAHYTDAAIRDETPADGTHFLVVTFTVKNQSASEKPIDATTFNITLTTADDAQVEWNEELLLPTADTQAAATVKHDAELQARIYFEVSKDTRAKSLALREGDDSRTYTFDLSKIP